MSYDIDILVSTERNIPTPEELKAAINTMPMIEEGKPPKGYIWQLDYLNPDTSVTFAFRYQTPTNDLIQRRAWETGLQISIPTTCPTFVARESFPVVAQFAKKFQIWLYLPNGEVLEQCDASQLQRTWTDINRRTVNRVSNLPVHKQPFYFPQEKLDEMWRYLSSRPALLKRYSPLGVYVPRVMLLRNKLNKKKVYRAAMWADLDPSVIPDVDIFIINKPSKLTFGRFPGGEYTPVIVHRDLIDPIIEPFLRDATRPIPHKLIENTKTLKLQI
ncbi:hypothetical protein IJT17_03925 [bacterium]|nr:hypothetical protein [bacterium]